MIKLVVSDMDGTLLDGTGYVPKEFYDVYTQLKDRDIKFAVASGRQCETLVNNFSNLKDDIAYIAENGALVRFQDRELYSATIDKDEVKKIIQVGEKIHGINIILCGNDCAYLKPVYGEILETVKYYYHSIKFVDDLNSVEDEIIKVAVLDLKGVEDNSFKIFYPKFGNNLQVKISGEVWMDIFSKYASKGIALRIIQKELNITKEETMSFGDYYNDLELFQESYHSYAMENAPEDVKKHARFRAKSNLDLGVISVIKEKVLGRNFKA